MTETLENPVIKDDEFGSQLREATEKADRGETYELPSAEQSEDRTPDTTETDTTVSSPDTTPEKKIDERPRDEKGRFTKTEAGEDIPEAERKPAEPVTEPAKVETKKEESAYVKAQKEKERQETVLRNFEAEKLRTRQELDAERQRLAAERQQWEQQKQQTQRNVDKPVASSEELKSFAAECTRKAREAAAIGDTEAAIQQADLATRASQEALKAAQFEQTAQYESEAATYQGLWTQDMERRLQEVPELRNPESEDAKGVMAAMQELPGFFERIPPMKLPDGRIMGGFTFAHEYFRLKKQAGAASGLEQKLKQVTAERDELRKKTAIESSGPTSHSAPQTYENMSDEEIEADLRRRSEGVALNF